MRNWIRCSREVSAQHSCSQASTGHTQTVRLSLILGIGLLYHVSDRIGIRLEARGWYTFVETGGGVFCSGGCVIAFFGKRFGQGELTAGLHLSF